jgi:hypothetical protein
MNHAAARWVVAALCALGMPLMASAQTGGKTVAGSLDVFVFPADDQTTEQQAQDEATCYQWATTNTGTDPNAIAKQQQANQQQAQADQQAAKAAGQGATQGAGARGAVRGAAAGAIIGEIASDDAGKGAAWGAAAGAVSGRRQAQRAQAQAQAQAQQQASAQAEQREALTAEQMANFKKAFSACLEAKQYSVKF